MPIRSSLRSSPLILTNELLPVDNCLESLICNIPVRESVTYLGIKIIKDDKIRCPSNFLPIIEKTRKVLNHWLQRDLSLKGRLSSAY